jgi:hypothetical protein
MWTEFNSLRIESSAVTDKGIFGYIKCRNFLHQLRGYQLLKKDCPPRRVTNSRKKKFWMCLGFTPSLDPQAKVLSGG